MGNGCVKNVTEQVESTTLPTFKVVVVGELGCGKTSIVRRFVENKFEVDYEETKDVDITSVVKKVNVPKHAIVSLELWDVPGQNDVDLRKTYYLDVDAVVVVADIANSSALKVAGSWGLDVANHSRVSRTFTETVPNPDGKTFSKKIRKEYVKPKPGSVPVLLLGNKYDLAKEKFLKELEESESREDMAHPLPDVVPHNNLKNDKTTDSLKQGSAILKKNNESILKKNNESEENVDVALKNADSVKNEKDDSAEVNHESAKNEKDDSAETQHDSAKEEHDESDKVEKENSGEIAEKDEENEEQEKVLESTESDNHLEVANEENKKKENSNGILNGQVVVTPSPEDVKSSVTYATSVASLLPPCVEEIERITEQYNFIAGVPVSAKTVNGGVQEAMQSLLRHLVAKKLFNLDMKVAISDRKNKNLDILSTRSAKSHVSKTSRNVRRKQNGNFEPLQEVGIIEIDEVIRRCNIPLREAEDLTGGYDEALHGFKMACFKHKLAPSTRASLEVCITALKQNLSSMTDDPVTSQDPRENIRLLLLPPEKRKDKESVLSLITEDVDGFPDLRIVDADRNDVEKLLEDPENQKMLPEIPSKILNILAEYREKFLVKSIDVAKHGRDTEAVLGQKIVELAAKEEKAWETAVAAGLSDGEVRRILSTLAQDKARLRGTTEHVRDTRRAVQTASGKIRASLLF